MKDNKKIIKLLTAISLSCYAFFLLLGLPGLASTLGIFDELFGWTVSIGLLPMIVITAVGSVYGSIVIIPTALCVASLITKKPQFPFFCIMFDVAVIILNINFLKDAIVQKELFMSFFWAVLLLASIVMISASIYRTILARRENR